jgi:hypothetical protein
MVLVDPYRPDCAAMVDPWSVTDRPLRFRKKRLDGIDIRLSAHFRGNRFVADFLIGSPSRRLMSRKYTLMEDAVGDCFRRCRAESPLIFRISEYGRQR